MSNTVFCVLNLPSGVRITLLKVMDVRTGLFLLDSGGNFILTFVSTRDLTDAEHEIMRLTMCDYRKTLDNVVF